MTNLLWCSLSNLPNYASLFRPRGAPSPSTRSISFNPFSLSICILCCLLVAPFVCHSTSDFSRPLREEDEQDTASPLPRPPRCGRHRSPGNTIRQPLRTLSTAPRCRRLHRERLYMNQGDIREYFILVYYSYFAPYLASRHCLCNRMHSLGTPRWKMLLPPIKRHEIVSPLFLRSNLFKAKIKIHFPPNI